MLDLRQGLVIDDLGLLWWRAYDFAEGCFHIGEVPIESVGCVAISKDQSEKVSSVQSIEVLLLCLEVLERFLYKMLRSNGIQKLTRSTK